MRRFHLNFNTVKRALVAIVLLTLLSVMSAHYWKLKAWRDLRHTLVPPEMHTFSISEMMGSTNVFEVVKPNVSTILMEPANPFSLSKQKNGRRPFAVILVTSLARFFNQRHAIRSTWYKWAEELNIRIFFMIGFHGPATELYQILGEEQRRHKDLIIDDYEEGYYKLPGKVLRMLKWYNSTYSEENEPRFLIKTDQDVFINLPNIVATLKNTSYYSNLANLAGCRGNQYATNSTLEPDCFISDDVHLPLNYSDPDSYFIGGKRFDNAEIETDPDSKWYIDSSERDRFSWPSNIYPTYLNGPIYVLSGNVAKRLYETSFTVPLYPFEDVYIVGMIAYDRLNLEISNMTGLILNAAYYRYLRKRSVFDKLLAVHPVEHPATMWKLCKRVSTCTAFTSKSSDGTKMTKSNTLVLFLMVVHFSNYV